MDQAEPITGFYAPVHRALIRARLRQAFTAPVLTRTLDPIARWLSPCANLSRNTSRILRIDNLSPGIPFPC